MDQLHPDLLSSTGALRPQAQSSEQSADGKSPVGLSKSGIDGQRKVPDLFFEKLDKKKSP